MKWLVLFIVSDVVKLSRIIMVMVKIMIMVANIA